MMNGTCTHFVLSAGYGSEGGSSGYSRARNDYQISTNDNYGGGYNRSSNNYHRGSGGGNDMRLETQYDTIFIQNLPRNVTAFELKNVFSQIGMIRVGYEILFFFLFFLFLQ